MCVAAGGRCISLSAALQIDRAPPSQLAPVGVHGEDGADVQGADVVGGAVHELADDDAVGPLRGVERVPEGEHVPVGAHVGRRRAQPDPVVRALPAARHLHVREPCRQKPHMRRDPPKLSHVKNLIGLFVFISAGNDETIDDDPPNACGLLM